jgi:transcription factor SFP1
MAHVGWLAYEVLPKISGSNSHTFLRYSVNTLYLEPANGHISMVMMGTSPSAFHHSSSFQSSSYLPKMEATILSNFQCCGLRHATMHDFVSHVEGCHNDQSKEIQERILIPEGFGRFQPVEPSRSMQTVQNSQIPRSSSSQLGSGLQNAGKSSLPPIQDIDTLEDMEMEDTPPATLPMQSINTGLAQGFRPSAPSTPNVTASFNIFSQDPTVSSVNTPTLSTHQVSQKTDLDSSMPNFPLGGLSAFDPSLSMFADDSLLPLDMNFDMNMALSSDMSNMTIHDPAKRLSSKNSGLDPSQLQFAMSNNGLQMDSDFQRALQQQQIQAGIPIAGVMGFPGQEEKKYRCPVIGCEKAYKNQNGLKYHKAVSFTRIP